MSIFAHDIAMDYAESKCDLSNNKLQQTTFKLYHMFWFRENNAWYLKWINYEDDSCEQWSIKFFLERIRMKIKQNIGCYIFTWRKGNYIPKGAAVVVGPWVDVCVVRAVVKKPEMKTIALVLPLVIDYNRSSVRFASCHCILLRLRQSWASLPLVTDIQFHDEIRHFPKYFLFLSYRKNFSRYTKTSSNHPR